MIHYSVKNELTISTFMSVFPSIYMFDHSSVTLQHFIKIIAQDSKMSLIEFVAHFSEITKNPGQPGLVKLISHQIDNFKIFPKRAGAIEAATIRMRKSFLQWFAVEFLHLLHKPY